MKKTLIFFTLLVLVAFPTIAQTESTNNVVGKNYKYYSKVLDEETTLQIYTPKNYLESDKVYPVLYVMDSQEYFLQAVAHQDMLRFKDYSPEFIVVGIKTDRQQRRQLLYRDSKKFTAYLNEEIVPYIDNNFRTLKEKIRIYFGWEMSGGFGLELLGNKESIFSDFILASPSHITEYRIDTIQDKLKKNSLNINSVYVSMASEEYFIEDEFKAVSKLFEGQKRLDSKAIFKVFNEETHYTTPNKTMHNGLLKVFQDYIPLRRFSLKEYDDFGDLKAIRNYYKQRGERYSIDTNIGESTIHFLIYYSMNEDNYKRFELYIDTFDDYLKTEIARDFWYDRFAQYFVKNNKLDKALKIYKTGLNKFPNSSLLNHEIGNTYKLQGELKNAENHYKKAIVLAKKNDDSELINYEKSLKYLKTK